MEGMSKVVSLADGREGGSMAGGRTLDFHSTYVADLPVEALPRRGGRLVGWLQRCCMEALLTCGFFEGHLFTLHPASPRSLITIW